MDAAVIHPAASWDLNAKALAVEAARLHPDRFAILGSFPIERPESRALIDGWTDQPGYTEELPWLSGRDQELVMGRAVCDWLRWKLPS